MTIELTRQQLQRLTVVVPPDSPVLCLICTERSNSPVMVVPAERWRCPGCNHNLEHGRGKGRCPSCGESRPAARKRWTYVVDCDCVQTPAQVQADQARAQERSRYYKREEARDVTPRVQATAARTEADACLATMPERRCQIPSTSLPHPFCGACSRFQARAHQPRTSTPLERASWGDRPGWVDKAPMRDITVSAAPPPSLRKATADDQLADCAAEIEGLL